MPKVLIAEDELMIADMIADVLAGNGYDICGITRSVAEAIELGEARRPDLAVIDLHLADGSLGTANRAPASPPGQPRCPLHDRRRE